MPGIWQIKIAFIFLILFSILRYVIWISNQRIKKEIDIILLLVQCYQNYTEIDMYVVSEL